MNNDERIQLKIDFLSSIGRPLDPDATILDFGCGSGGKVRVFLEKGFSCFGCDIALREDELSRELIAEERIRQIEAPYRLPYPDDFFDFVFSDQVFEHVQDHAAAFAEIARVMKPDAIAFHVFPPKRILIEPHVHIPLASWFRANWWIRLWTTLGVRGFCAHDVPSGAAAEQIRDYLRQKTNYRPQSEIWQLSQQHFESTTFPTASVLRVHPRLRTTLSRILLKFPGIGWFANRFLTVTLVQTNPRQATQHADSAAGEQS